MKGSTLETFLSRWKCVCFPHRSMLILARIRLISKFLGRRPKFVMPFVSSVRTLLDSLLQQTHNFVLFGSLRGRDDPARPFDSRKFCNMPTNEKWIPYPHKENAKVAARPILSLRDIALSPCWMLKPHFAHHLHHKSVDSKKSELKMTTIPCKKKSFDNMPNFAATLAIPKQLDNLCRYEVNRACNSPAAWQDRC